MADGLEIVGARSGIRDRIDRSARLNMAPPAWKTGPAHYISMTLFDDRSNLIPDRRVEYMEKRTAVPISSTHLRICRLRRGPVDRAVVDIQFSVSIDEIEKAHHDVQHPSYRSSMMDGFDHSTKGVPWTLGIQRC